MKNGADIYKTFIDAEKAGGRLDACATKLGVSTAGTDAETEQLVKDKVYAIHSIAGR